jgi:hypothetical protein
MIYLTGLLLMVGSIVLGLILKSRLPKVDIAMTTLICLSVLLILVAGYTAYVFHLFPGSSDYSMASPRELVQH